jgi:hypothetical protein
MPIKKKTTAAKKPAAKKPAVLGPKAKLMKLLVGTLRNKAKKLGISDVSKRTKENLAQSIMLAEARKKKGTTLGKKATAKKRTMAAKDENRQTGSSDFTRDYDRFAELPGKRNAKDTGNVYYERRKNRSDADRSFTGLQGEKYQGWTNYETWLAALWIDNDQKLNTAFRELIEAQKKGGALSFKELATIILYDTQKYRTQNDAVGLWLSDIVLNSYIEAVNWFEISRSIEENL